MQITERVSRPGWSRRDGDRFRATFVNAMAVAHFAAGRYAEAVASARNTFARSPEYPPGHTHFIAAAAMQGDMEAAAEAFAGLLRQRADFFDGLGKREHGLPRRGRRAASRRAA